MLGVTAESVRWRTVVNTVRIGGRDYRVLRPAAPLQGGLFVQTGWGPDGQVDAGAARDLALGWAAVARSPYTVVYFPFRRRLSAARRAELSQQRIEPPRIEMPVIAGPLDVVLVDHRIALPPSRWRSVRQRLGPGVGHVVDIPRSAFDPVEVREWEAMRYEGFRDLIRWDVAADTLILTGSRRAFRRDAAQLDELAHRGAQYEPRDGRDHYCAEIDLGRWRRLDKRGHRMRLHVQLHP